MPSPRPPYLINPVPMPPLPKADRVVKWRLWPGVEDWVCSEGEGYVVDATESEDWVGAFDEGNRMCAFRTGERFTYRFDREGTYYLAVIMDDDPDGPEELFTTLNGVQIGCAVADVAGGRALFSYTEPLCVQPGDALTFTTGYEVKCYRVYRLLFSRQPIVPPPPVFGNYASHVDSRGGLALYWTTTTTVETGQVELSGPGKSLRSAVSTHRGRNHRMKVDLPGLESGASYTARVHTVHDGRNVVSDDFDVALSPLAATAPRPIAVPFAVHEPTRTGRPAWPCWQGIPLQEGQVKEAADLRVTTATGQPVPSQARLQCRWPDGSVKWAALSLLTNTQVAQQTDYLLITSTHDPIRMPACADLTPTDTGWLLKSPRVELEIATDGSLILAARGCQLELCDARLGRLTAGPPETVTLTDNGPCRARLEWRGPLLTCKGEVTPWQYELAAQISPDHAAVQFDAGIWFADATPVFSAVESLEFRMNAAGGAAVRWADERVAMDETASVVLRQITQDRACLCAGVTRAVERAPSALCLEGNGSSVTVGMPDFWRSWPSGIQARPDEVRIQILPPLAADEYDDERDHPRFHHIFAWFDRGRYMVRAGQTIRGAWWVHIDAEQTPDTLAEWYDEPLRAEFGGPYLCGTGAIGRPLFPADTGHWPGYEEWFRLGFEALEQDRLAHRAYGWMHLGDWWGERGKNYGNNEYDLAWCLGIQWLRAGDREVFRRGLEMARHYTGVDSCREANPFPFTATTWKHSCNHIGSALDPEELNRTEAGRTFLESFGGELTAAMDPMGHLNLQGSWLMGLLADDPWIVASARRTCTWVADRITTTFDFNMEREGAWPVANMATAYALSGDVYYLNAARLMADRCIERQDAESGAWLHQPLPTETGNVAVIGGKTFAAGALCTGLLRYLEVEPEQRPDVRHMLVRYADWLMTEAWDQEAGGFYYITNSPVHRERGGQRNVSETGMNAETTLFAYEQTGRPAYLEFWKEMMRGYFERPLSGMGKDFSQQTYNAVWGLDRALRFGVTQIAPLSERLD